METKYLTIIILLVVTATGGFLVGKTISQTPTQTKTASVQNPLFRSQTATFQGEITKVNKDSLDVKSDNGQTGSLTLSNKVVIYKFKEGSKQASASSDLASLETDKKVVIILDLSNSQYKVISISYQPPAATPSATPLKKK